MVSLADEARSRVRKQGPRCDVAAVLAEFGAELQEALDDLTIPATAIQDTLATRDVQLSEFSIRRHRRGRCRC